jgi:hypothetical protein
MPADASIYSLIRPTQQQPGPLDNFGQVLQLRHLMDASSLNDLQRKQLERNISDEEGTAAAYRESGGDPTKLKELLYGKGLYKPAMAAEKNALEAKEKKASIDEKEAGTKLKNWELGDKIHTENLQDLQGANDQAGWDRMRANVYERYARQIGPDEAARRIQSIPGVFDPNAKQQLLMTGLKTKEFLDMMKPDMKEVTDGQRKFFVDVNPKSNPDILKMKVQLVASPDARLADERSREKMAQDAEHYDSERGVIINTQTGVTRAPTDLPAKQDKPPAGYRWGADGKTLEAIPGGPTDKIPEAQLKQKIGVDNTKAALQEYINELKSWSNASLVNPAARARMGTVYNNALLQAKEAYNLGVLNGPDYQILQEVLTNPASLKGGLTPNTDLAGQATKLSEILSRIGQTVETASRQRGAPTDAAAAPAKVDTTGFKVIRVERKP